MSVGPSSRPGFRVEVDDEHGGRWTSLRDPSGREWLWSRPDPARGMVQPGDAFVDAGGVEECFPTITGSPDHGDVWTRAWAVRNGQLAVRTGHFELRRRLCVGNLIEVHYRLTGPPGAPFIWAFHALLQPAVGTRIIAGPGLSRTWATDGTAVDDGWPAVAGRRGCDVLGPDDGTAVFCVLPGMRAVSIEQGGAQLRLALECDHAPVSFGIWRNLGGFPASGPRYRSFGIEPMLGGAPKASAHTGDAATVPASGLLTWRLSIS